MSQCESVLLVFLRGHPVQRLWRMFYLLRGAGARGHHCQAPMSLHLPQRVTATPSNALREMNRWTIFTMLAQLEDWGGTTSTTNALLNEILEYKRFLMSLPGVSMSGLRWTAPVQSIPPSRSCNVPFQRAVPVPHPNTVSSSWASVLLRDCTTLLCTGHVFL